MGTLYLVRHGQASFGADDYDKLSPLGHRQSQRLGAWFARQGIAFDALIAGTLRRHTETLAGIQQGLGTAAEHLALPGLNEYDSEAVVATVHDGPLARATTPEQVRQHFRLLREGLLRWMAGEVTPHGMPSYADFSAGVADALARVRADHVGRNVLMVSSGGPISTAVGQVLGLDSATTIELNLRMRNSSVTEFATTPKRHALVSFNALPHLGDGPDDAAWVTYA